MGVCEAVDGSIFVGEKSEGLKLAHYQDWITINIPLLSWEILGKLSLLLLRLWVSDFASGLESVL